MKEDMLIGENLQRPNINVFEYPIVKCAKCAHPFFVGRIVMRRIPGFIAGTGNEDVLLPMKVMVCDKCGEAFEDDVKNYHLEELYDDKKSDTVDKKENTTLIL